MWVSPMSALKNTREATQNLTNKYQSSLERALILLETKIANNLPLNLQKLYLLVKGQMIFCMGIHIDCIPEVTFCTRKHTTRYYHYQILEVIKN